jgi:hypothetical protein
VAWRLKEKDESISRPEFEIKMVPAPRSTHKRDGPKINDRSLKLDAS